MILLSQITHTPLPGSFAVTTVIAKAGMSAGASLGKDGTKVRLWNSRF